MTESRAGASAKEGLTSTSRSFARTLTLSTAAAPAITFLAAPLLARAVGVDGRGTLAAVVASFLIVRYLSSLGGLDAALAAANWSSVGVGGSLRAVGRWIAPISIVVAGVAWFVAPWIFPLDDSAVTIFRLLLILIPIAALSDGWRAALTAGQRSVPVATHVLGLPVVRLIGAVIMAVSGASSVTAASWISVGGLVIGFVVLAAVSVPEIRASSIGREEEARFRGFALRLAPGQAARLGNLRLDQVLLGAVAGAKELGLYAVAVAVAEIADVFTRTVRQIAIRSINDAVDHEELERLFRVGLVFWLSTSLVVGAVIPFGIPLVFGDEFSGAILPAEILLIAGLGGYVRDILGLVLIRAKSASRDSLVQLTTLLVGVVALAFLGEPWGAQGAAVAALVSYLVAAAMVAGLYTRERELSVSSLLPGRGDIRRAYTLVRR